MSDCFISYSRSDAEFVGALASALKSRGKDVWVDRQDIPPSAEWYDRITEGIREADAFIVVLTPAWLDSTVCARELALAADLNKRLVPLLHRAVPVGDVPDALARHNWIDGTAGDTEAVIEQLIQAVDTDLEWVQAHTRWLVDAVRWSTAKRSRAMLPRGVALREAETWLAASPGKKPEPTSLHHEFILAGRQASSRLQRQIIAAISLALVVAIGLGLFALAQRNEARAQQREALSRELAASAFLNLPNDPELGLLLALRAASVRFTDQAREALREGLIESRVRTTFQGLGGRVEDASMSPDGEHVVVGNEDGTARLWQIGRQRPIAALRGHQTAVHRAVFSPNGRLIATAAQDATVRIWDAHTGGPVAVLRDERDRRLTDIAWSPDSRRILIGAFTVAPRVWRVRPARLEYTLPAGASFADSVAWGRHGRIAVGTQTGNSYLYAARSGRQTAVLRGETKRYVHRVVFDPKGTTLATGGEDGRVRLYNLRGRLLHEIRAHTAPITALAFSRDGDLVISGSTDRTAKLIDIRTGDIQDLRGHDDPIRDVAIDRSGAMAATSSDDGTARLWDTRTGIQLAVFRGHRGAVDSAQFTTDGSRLLTGAADGSARLWATTSGGFSAGRPITSAQAFGAAISSSGRHVELLTAAGVTVFDPRGRRRRFSAEAPPGFTFVPGVSNDGRLAVVETTGRRARTQLYDLQTTAVRATLDAGENGVTSVDFDSSGRRVATAGRDGVARIFDTRSGRLIKALRGHRTSDAGGAMALFATAARWAAGDHLLATMGDDSTARVWDIGTGRQLAVVTLPRRPAPMNTGGSVDISPDGRFMVTAVPWSATATVWEWRSQRIVGRLRGHSSAITSVRYSPDASMITTASFDGTARVWDATSGRSLAVLRPSLGAYDSVQNDVATHSSSFTTDGRQLFVVGTVVRPFSCEVCRATRALVRLARTRVTRSLSAQERATYLHQGV